MRGAIVSLDDDDDGGGGSGGGGGDDYNIMMVVVVIITYNWRCMYLYQSSSRHHHDDDVMMIATGTWYMLPAAYDVDSEPNAVVRYELQSEDAAIMTSGDDVTFAVDDDVMLPFRLETTRRDDSSYDLRLVVSRPLDREVCRRAIQRSKITIIVNSFCYAQHNISAEYMH